MRLGMFFREALRSIRANAAISVAATVTALIAVFILGAFIPSFMYVRSAVDAQTAKVDVDVYIADTATVPQVNALREKLDGLRTDGTVAAVALETSTIRPMASGTHQMAGCSHKMRSRGWAAQKSPSGNHLRSEKLVSATVRRAQTPPVSMPVAAPFMVMPRHHTLMNSSGK